MSPRPERAALLIIDMQRGGRLLDGSSGLPRMPGYGQRVQRAAGLVERCRDLGVPVIFFMEEHRRSLIDFGRELDGREGIHCLEGDDNTEIDEEFGLGDTDFVIRKRRYSCFFGTELDILLRCLNVDTLILAGELTDVCVQYTFVDAHQRDYHLRVAVDCCGGSSQQAHDAAMMAMSYLQTSCLTTTRQIAEWLSEAVPAFAKEQP